MLKKKKPLFSIITVVLNNRKYVEKTIKSVLSQTNKDFEYIIVDGGSSDGTLQIVNRYKKKVTKIINEKDEGIYDAFNKGMKLANGEYICIVNSDDRLKINALKIIKKYIDRYPEADVFFGSVRKHWGILHGYRPEKIKYSWGFYSSHSTGFYLKKSSAKKIGFYDIKYKYHADYDYFYRMIVKKKMKGFATKKHEVVGIFRRGGFSSTIPFRKMFVEELKIRYNNGQSIILLLILGIYKILNYWKKKIVK